MPYCEQGLFSENQKYCLHGMSMKSDQKIN